MPLTWARREARARSALRKCAGEMREGVSGVEGSEQWREVDDAAIATGREELRELGPHLFGDGGVVIKDNLHLVDVPGEVETKTKKTGTLLV